MNALRPENKALFRISKTPRIKTQGKAFDGSLADSKSEQHKHNIACHKMNTAHLLQPIVTSTTAKERTPTESYSLSGVSLSKDQFNQLTNNS